MSPEHLKNNLQKATALHRAGKFPRAEAIYKKILKAFPENPDALHFYGLLYFNRGEIKTAQQYLLAAIGFKPDYIDAYLNLGNIFLQVKQLEDARKCYEKAIELDPTNAGIGTNYGILLRYQGSLKLSSEVLNKVCELRPDWGLAHYNLANTLLAQKKFEEAFNCAMKAVDLNTDAPSVWRLGLKLCQILDRPEAATTLITKWRKGGKDIAVLDHLLAAYSSENVPEKASAGYVKSVFDSYAKSFESSLANLGYQGPNLLKKALEELEPSGSSAMVAMDAGCGTGLSAPVLKPFVKRLYGVDLSPEMLKLAKAKGVYHRLLEDDLVAGLNAFEEHFDLISSMDVLIYFGELQSVFDASYKALKDQGHLVFTVEANDQDSDYRLSHSGRYVHSLAYISATLTASGFEYTHETANIRFELGENVVGYLVTATKVC